MLGYVFPGQGTQRVGMGGAVRAASSRAVEVFEEASDLAGIDMVALCTAGTEEELTDTRRAQLAIYTVNAATLAVVSEVLGEPDLVAGHSVGEWSAFFAAGAVSFAAGFEAVRERARIMADSAVAGAMVAIAGLSAVEVAALCEQVQAGVAQVAVRNAPALVVAAGEPAAVDEVAELARAAGAVRVTPVRTSHAFHSALMSAATGPWREAVAVVPMTTPRCPVALNHSGHLSTDVAELREGAIHQIEAPVLWADCLEALADAGATQLVEAGDSKTLAAFSRATIPDVPIVAMGAPHALRRLRTIRREHVVP